MAHNDKPSLDELLHTGVGHLDGGNSGRFPWGSGEHGYQRSGDFLARLDRLKAAGFKETPEEIEKCFGMSTAQFRAAKSFANDQRNIRRYERVRYLKDKEGMGWTEIAKVMGEKNESTVRTMYQNANAEKMYRQEKLVDYLRDYVDSGKNPDVGDGVELDISDIMGVTITKTNLDNALEFLKAEGYEVHGARYEQPTNPRGQKTTVKVLYPPGTPASAAYDPNTISSLKDYEPVEDKPERQTFKYPESMDMNRLMVRGDEDGGSKKDGIIEIRPGVKDLDLGANHYAQVRILVDKKYYLKGMALYGDPKDFPKGVDVIFNSNKSKELPKEKHLKGITADPDNPFGSAIKQNGGQSTYIGDDGKEHLSLINKRAEEGDWNDWKDAVPSQFLSKQPIALAKRQLNLAKVGMMDEYNSYAELTNPVVKKKMLLDFANKCDSTAVHLQGAALPGQKYHVIIPITTLKDNEIYAPKYENGTKLALIRYPHAGTFEIPIVTVNNKNALASKLLGPNIVDAVGINANVAERLSGADFDGDTVMCIPTHDPKSKIKINSTDPLPGLKDFNPKILYSGEEKVVNGKVVYLRNGKEYPLMGERAMQNEMGKISNLITDMTLGKNPASDEEKARAVRHSMVVIDAKKHHLDYKQSEKDNGIKELKLKYQGGKNAGAATIISRAKSKSEMPRVQGEARINLKYDPLTGEKNKFYDPTKKEGTLIYKTADDKNRLYADRDKNKETGMITLRTIDGKKVEFQGKKDDNHIFSAKEKKDYEYYRPVPIFDPKDNKKILGFVNNGDGTIRYRMKERKTPTTKMMMTEDAHTLKSSHEGNPMENLYADYANYMRDLGRKARIEAASTPKIAYNPSAAKTYAEEVQSLKNKVENTRVNKPRERMAVILANAEIMAKKNSNPDIGKDELKKIKSKAMIKYRNQVGAERREVVVTDREWAAIQSGAVRQSTIEKVLNYADNDKIKERATPRAKNELSTSQKARIKAYANSNYTINEIAKQMGVSTSTITKYING